MMKICLFENNNDNANSNNKDDFLDYFDIFRYVKFTTICVNHNILLTSNQDPG